MVTCGSSRDAESLASSSFFWRWARRRRFWRAWRRSRASAGVRTIRRDGGTGFSVVSGSADDADDAAGFLAVEASVRVEGVARWRMRARGGSLAGALSATGAFFGVASELSFPWGKLKTTGDAPSSRFPWRRRGPWWRRGWRRGPGDRLPASGISDLSGEAQQSLQLQILVVLRGQTLGEVERGGVGLFQLRVSDGEGGCEFRDTRFSSLQGVLELVPAIRTGTPSFGDGTGGGWVPTTHALQE